MTQVSRSYVRRVVTVLNDAGGTTLVELECAHRARFLGTVLKNQMVTCDYCMTGAMPQSNRTHAFDDDDTDVKGNKDA